MRRSVANQKDLGLRQVRRTRSGKRIRSGLSDGKTLSLYQAMLGLLAEKDFEAISVARIAKTGDCSVGAFYGRFPRKSAFLELVISETFRQMAARAERVLDAEAMRGESRSKIIRKIVEHISSEFSDPENTGVIRAAVKLGFSDRKAREAFDNYRATLGGMAKRLLGSSRGAGSGINDGMQITFGACTGAIVTEEWPRKSSLSHMNDALCDVLTQLPGRSEKPSSKPLKQKLPETASAEKSTPRKSGLNTIEIPAGSRRGGRKAI